ncbi:family 43 glycosylhydrolase, partial [Arachidicoccus sp.]|uniref:family 43 glycosylhydrolase n=1 Tax=Arachidicoccus sp. TaxID=1872624 RepID=UPI003D1B679B
MAFLKQRGINIILVYLLSIFAVHGQNKHAANHDNYLFVYFTGNKQNEESIHFALSRDGYNFYALNHNRPVLDSKKISSTGGVRDPHILRGEDKKTFYMVATDMVSSLGWNSNRAMVLMKSKDLIHWKSSVVNIQRRFSGQENLLRVWAPQTIYDPVAKKYMIYFSMKHGDEADKIYYSYVNKKFTDLETAPKQLLYEPSNGSCIDPDIIYFDGKYHLFFKTEDKGKGIKIATSTNLTSGYVIQDGFVQQTKEPVEGSSVYALNNGNGFIFMYDMYTKGKYQFTYTKDLNHFSVVDKDISMDFHPRHGTVLPITTKEANGLKKYWGDENIYERNNPVLKGYFADPEILYSKKTDSFYIYPTSDGFTNWSGNYFKTFASKDLVHWKDGGVILDLPKDVSWAKKNAWAPCIIEKEVGDSFKYYFYFTAAQKIGVAVANSPGGPFKDSGRPLIDKFPPGIHGGQQIDPDVFQDPVSKKNYLYWGNGYMASAELNDDMISIKENTIKVITPKRSFREGTYVFYRKGKYYFLWSEDDTRSPNYHVCYGIADHPQGKIVVPKSNIILSKDSTLDIFGTGHCSVIQIPGKDKWYIVYHR